MSSDRFKAALAKYQVDLSSQVSVAKSQSVKSAQDSSFADSTTDSKLSASPLPYQVKPPKKNPYISNPNQLRALQLSSKFGDQDHKILYLNLCKNVHPTIIDQAESFVSDASAHNKGALFMWRVKKIKQEWQEAGKNWRNPHKLPPKPKRKPRLKKTAMPTLFDSCT